MTVEIADGEPVTMARVILLIKSMEETQEVMVGRLDAIQESLIGTPVTGDLSIPVNDGEAEKLEDIFQIVAATQKRLDWCVDTINTLGATFQNGGMGKMMGALMGGRKSA